MAPATKAKQREVAMTVIIFFIEIHFPFEFGLLE